MFHPNLGRWMQEDPKGFDAGDLNLYRGVENNTTNLTDPSGLQPPAEIGGRNCNMRPFYIGLDRAIVSPPSKAECLAGVPFLRKHMLPLCPKEMRKKTCVTDTGWSGEVPKGWSVGPSGCGPCVGLVLVPLKPGMKYYVCHFSPKAEIEKSCHEVGFLTIVPRFAKFWPVDEGYKAILCGSEYGKDSPKVDEEARKHCLSEVVNCLRRYKVPISQYIPAPGFVVDQNGKVYWTTPDTLPVDGYEK
jgi:hypothetical protein